MDQAIHDAVEELSGVNKEFILDYLQWADSLENCTLQLDRPLVWLLRSDGSVAATIELTTALVMISKVEPDAGE